MALRFADPERRRKALRRYRFMFKATLVEFAIAVVMIVIGVFVALASSETWLIGVGSLLVAATFFNGWKILNSTVRLLELEAGDGGWQQLV